MNVSRAYRCWMWRRLGLLLPAQAAALGVNLWLAFRAPGPFAIRIPCLILAGMLAALIAYFMMVTARTAGRGSRLTLQQARVLRRHARPTGLIAAASTLLLGMLAIIPLTVGGRDDHRITVVIARHRQLRPQAPPVQIPTPEPPAPAPLEPIRGEPEIGPIVEIAPLHLELPEVDFLLPPRPLEIPDVPAAQAATSSGRERFEDPLHFPLEKAELLLGENRDRSFFALGIRPLPDESDLEGWPSPEARFEGFLLLGSSDSRVPGIALSIDFPFSRNDSVTAGWMAMILPGQDTYDREEVPNWHHLTLAYTRRLSGFTSHAPFDLAASLGISADFLGAVAGVPDHEGAKFAAFAAIDASLWQEGVVGLLFHLGQCVPVRIAGSSLGVTEFSTQIRFDLSERISIQGGYRVLLLRYSLEDDQFADARLKKTLSGPVLGVDVRF